MLKIPEKIALVLNTLTQNGYEAYIVGGCVRDFSLGFNPSDYDITTSARPNEVTALFKKTVPTGIKHGTVTVMIEKEPIEVTTFRTDGGYADSRHPESVEFVMNLREDLSRRDFTVNAMAYNQNEGLVDLFGGISDLENKILRTVGDPDKRFCEDALRILRLFRFASQLDFSIEENTLKSALRLQKGLENISRERIFAEIKKSLSGKNPQALKPLVNSGGLAFLGIDKIPDFKAQNHKLFELLKANENPIGILRELKASNKEIDFCEKLLKLSSLTLCTKEEIKNAMFLTDAEAVKAYFEYINKENSLLNEISENNEPYLISHLALTGEDLKSLGFSGKKIGQTLERLRLEVVKHPEKNTKEILIALTK